LSSSAFALHQSLANFAAPVIFLIFQPRGFEARTSAGAATWGRALIHSPSAAMRVERL
jgi:hypothetical protein